MTGTMSFLNASGEVIPTHTPLVLQREAEQIVKRLAGIGAKFLIVLPGGERYGEIVEFTKPAEAVKPKRTKAPPRLGFGVISGVLRPLLDNLQPGQVVEIPIMGEDAEATRSAATARCAYLWGNGSYSSLITGNHIEIFRRVVVQPRFNGGSHANEVHPPV